MTATKPSTTYKHSDREEDTQKTQRNLKGARESAYLSQVKWCKHKERRGRRKSYFAAGEGG